MKRLARRTLAVVIGLALGWYVAGLVPAMPGLNVSMAEDSATHNHAVHSQAATTQPAHESEGEAEGEGEDGHGAATARELVPADPARDIAWYRPVLWTVAGLFAAAILLGIPALKLRGPLPPDPADAHHDERDAHAGGTHDAHGARGDDKGHGHGH